MSNPKQFCITPEPEDSPYFCSSIVINQKYLAIGDISANRVIIYTPNDSRQWIRTKEILPPRDFDSAIKGSIFGYNLEIEENILSISARSKSFISKEQVAHLSPLEKIKANYSYWRYLINLETQTEVKSVRLLVEKEFDSVSFNLLREGKIEQVVLHSKGEQWFGADIALHQNLLLVGSPSYTEAGGAWLFDLDKPQTESIKLIPKNVNFATVNFGETVAISEQFAVVGNRGILWYLPAGSRTGNPEAFTKTLIRNLKNGSTKIIDNYGELSLSSDILAITRFPSPDGEFKPLLEVFHLNEDATPNLISRRTDISSGFVQNGFLVTLQDLRNFSSIQVCIEPLN